MSEYEEAITEIYPDRPDIKHVIGFLSACRVLESALISPQTNEFIEACRIVENRLREEIINE